MLFKRIVNIIKREKIKRSSAAFIEDLRSKGVKIGGGNKFRPRTTQIDISRPSLITIGDNCYFNENFSLLTHDWVTRVFLFTGRDFINSSGHVTIGNNVSFGQNVTVLKGVTIGDNCFIGAGSIVSKDIPANSIAVGAPCKVIMSLEDYYQKRLQKCEAEALEYARSIYDRFGRKPIPSDFREEFIWFVSGNEVAHYPDVPIRRQLGPIYDKYVKEHKAKYSSFEDFLRAAGIKG